MPRTTKALRAGRALRCGKTRYAILKLMTLHMDERSTDVDCGQWSGTYLRITKSASRREGTTAESTDPHVENGEREMFERDDEALVARSHQSAYSLQTVTYDVIHSVSYQVPVLYLTMTGIPAKAAHEKCLDIDEVLKILTPDSFRPQLRATSPLGALTMTDHPVTGLAAYFVHPCRTAEVTEHLVKGRVAVTPTDYLLLWMGVIGAAVGLSVPIEVATQLPQAGI